ncbi:hypothetical protein [Streptomyces sp. NBC_01353]|uniref:hypothetical protein n=1 Tax=Streptomyces sp. NBC_01353 TaxID=2903835 RepID=UPI003DA2F769
MRQYAATSRSLGLVLFPGDGDNSNPDVDWSYSGFAAFRWRLAQAEGFSLADMWGGVTA